MQIITLLKPHFLSTIAAIRHKGFERETRQSFLILTFCFGLAIALYLGARHVMHELAQLAHLAYLPVSHILGLFLLVLFFTLIVSNLAIALGRFYQSNDTDLLLSSPVSFSTVFFLRSTLVFISATWMPALFLVPVLLGVLGPYALSASALAAMLPLLFCFFIIPTGLAISIATLILYLTPTNYIRYILLLLAAVILYSIWHFHGAVSSNDSSLVTAQGILRMISVLSLHHIDWLPGNWVARSVEKLVQGTFSYYSAENQLLFGTALFVCAFAYCIFLLLFDEALAHMQGSNTRPMHNSRFTLRTILLKLPFDSHVRALLGKEYQLLFRDPAQLVQISLLFILSSLYLYNLETLAFASQFSSTFNQNWSNFMSITTVSIGCFFTIAVATRIVFPSLSLEGSVFNLLQSAPITMRQLLKIKFWLWFIPLAFVSTLFFALGGYAIHLSLVPHILISLFGTSTAYSAVGLAIGLGAKFSRFDWEYSTQLAASFGSVLYMLITVSTIALSGFILLPLTFQINKVDSLNGLGLILAVSAFILSLLPGFLAVHWATRSGLRELQARIQ